jgi:hypothetical protein
MKALDNAPFGQSRYARMAATQRHKGAIQMKRSFARSLEPVERERPRNATAVASLSDAAG